MAYGDDTQAATPKLATPKTPAELARENWARYEYVRDRGHIDYIREAKELERQYMGGGKQAPDAVRQYNDRHRLPTEEINMIKPAVNALAGYQIANRMDISLQPRGGDADDQLAQVLSKVIMQIADNNRLHWLESNVFLDGLIERRGYYDVRINLDDSMLGEVLIEVRDNRDVIPDPDSNSYDPDDWYDVTVTHWFTPDEIEGRYGAEARRAIEMSGETPSDSDIFEDSRTEGRNHFGNDSVFDSTYTELGQGPRRYRVIDRQYWELVPTMALVSPNGDIRQPDGLAPDRVAELLASGWTQVRRIMKRVRWTVSTRGALLQDLYSPYAHFTIVPYFPIFRRGLTSGLVDDAVSPQRVLNKAINQFIRIVNDTANSGWDVEQNSLTNMKTTDLEKRGGEPGLVLEYKKGAQPPQKRKPNEIPQGYDRLIALMVANIREVTGANAANTGDTNRAESGLSKQVQQYAAQQEWAMVLDNLARSRHMLATRILDCVQRFYDDPRILRISEMDMQSGKRMTSELPINQPLVGGGKLNDLTIGEYDIVVTETPMQVTFMNSQFQQAMELKEKGAPIPWSYVIRYSTLADKGELAASMDETPPPDPVAESVAELNKAKTEEVKANTVNKRVESQFSSVQAAQAVAAIPDIAALADAMLLSAGYVDSNAPPIISPPPAGIPAPPPPPRNTNPLTPRNPDVGMMTGIEGGGDNPPT